MSINKKELEIKLFTLIKNMFPKIYRKKKKLDDLDLNEIDSLQKINLMMEIERQFKMKFKTTDFDKIKSFKNLVSKIN